MASCWQQLLEQGLSELGGSDAEQRLRWWISDRLECGINLIPLTDSPSPGLETEFHSAVSRLAQHEPVQYICGRAPFMDFELTVSPSVLIPRPETEYLVHLALERWIIGNETVADIGTGSGCIAIAIKRARPDCQVIAIDRSEAAAMTAQKNAEALQADVDVRTGDLTAGLADQSLDVMMANLPYVTEAEMDILPENVKRFEPHSALVAGPDGLSFIRRLIADADRVCRPGGRILLETGEQQASAIEDHARIHGWQVEHAQDLAGRPRYAMLTRA